MKVGFTGTRDNITLVQVTNLWNTLKAFGVTELHHGMCVGADQIAHKAAGKLGIARVAHPPLDTRQIFEAPAEDFLAIKTPRAYLDRNKEIVRCADRLFAMPKGKEELRSGTWSTVRWARKRNVPVTIFWPDGRVEHEV